MMLYDGSIMGRSKRNRQNSLQKPPQTKWTEGDGKAFQSAGNEEPRGPWTTFNIQDISRTTIFIPFLFILIWLFLYPALYGPLTNWDDNQLVINNITLGQPLMNALTEMFSRTYLGHYNPLVIFTFWLNYQIGGVNPFGYKLVNLILHTVNCGVLFVLLQVWGVRPFLAFLLATLFALHPQRIEAIAWVTERKTVLSSFFFFLSLLFYSLAQSPSWKSPSVIWSWIFFVLGCLSKAAAPTFFLLLFLIDWIKGRCWSRPLLVAKIPFLVVCVIFAYVAVSAASRDGATEGAAQRMGLNLLTAIHGLWFYPEKLVVPLWLASYYPPITMPNGISSFTWARIALGLGTSVGIGYLILRRPSRPLAFAALWYLFLFLPVSQLLPAGTASAADRYTYLFHPGVLGGLGLALQSLKFSRLRKITIHGLLAVFIAVCASLSVSLIPKWYSIDRLWSHNIRYYPSSLAFTQRATEHFRRNRSEAAEEDLGSALAIQPDYAYALSNLGLLRIKSGDLEEAARLLSMAMTALPPKYDMLVTAASLARDLGAFEETQILAIKARDLDPRRPQAYCLLAEGLYAAGKDEEALRVANETLSTFPAFVEAYNIRGQIWQRLGNSTQAESDYSFALALDKTYIEARINRAILFTEVTGQFQKAQEDLELAKHQAPEMAAIWNAFGGLRMHQQRSTEALTYFEKAVGLEPKNPLYWLNLGRAHLGLGQPQKARSVFAQLVREHPELQGLVETILQAN